MSIKHLEVLVADDHKLTRDMIGQVLKALECKRVRFVADGADAFSEIINFPPDIAIIDYDMPLDGLSLLTKIRRAANSPDPTLPVIVMTSLTVWKRVSALRVSGASEVIAKPFNAAAVLSRIAALIENPRDFIRTRNFIGPDRRRRTDVNYSGPFRRAHDSALVELL